jgi:YfiR/HmsC-like
MPNVRGLDRTATALALAAALLWSAAAGSVRAQQRIDEYRLKAAVLYNLTKFVEWPGESFPVATSPFVICILGIDPFGTALDESLPSRPVGGRAVVVRRIADVETGCHILFIADSEVRRLPSIMDKLRGASVLTVGEVTGFVDRGGVIGLVTEDDRVRFEINADAAAKARLKISARLMTLASTARRRGDPAP